MARSSPPTPAPDLRILLLGDSTEDAGRLRRWLAEPARARLEVVHLLSLNEALERLRCEVFDAALIDLSVGDGRGMQTFLACRAAAPALPMVVLSHVEREKLALDPMAAGAQDFLVQGKLTRDLVRQSLRYAIERKAAERHLRDSRERYRLAIAGANDGIWDWDIVRGELFLSDRWCQMLGYGRQDVGTGIEDWLSLVHPQDQAATVGALDSHLEGRSEHFEVEHQVLHRDGSWRWVRTRGLAVRDGDGRATRMAGSQSDVTARRESEARLLHQALHDGLTGLPNRTMFRERLEDAVERSQALEGHGFALLFLDLDRFKVVNDSMGHQAGDELLVGVARRLEECIRPVDTVARLGGDEFGVLVVEPESPGMAEDIADRIHRAVCLPFTVRSQEVYTTVSVGIVRPGGGQTSPEALLRHADIAMYRAKKAGRSRSEVFDETLHAWATARLAIENALHGAVERNELFLHYQPIVRLEDAGLVGFEALVRWKSPELGMLGPDEFIPVAEETGLIDGLGKWVLQRACRDMAELNALLPEGAGVSVSVNVSSRQLGQARFAGQVEAALAETGMRPDRLVLELTETALMDNPVRAAEVLTRLRAQGIRVHLDDFGAGYSSLGYLRRFPIDSAEDRPRLRPRRSGPTRGRRDHPGHHGPVPGAGPRGDRGGCRARRAAGPLAAAPVHLRPGLLLLAPRGPAGLPRAGQAVLAGPGASGGGPGVRPLAPQVLGCVGQRVSGSTCGT